MMNNDEIIEDLTRQVQEKFLASGEKVAVAESCTGGFLGEVLTDRAGSSGYFLGGVIAYADSVKTGLLNVAPDALQEYGAVSVAVARQMAEGVLALTGADAALAITGIAGPDGGGPDKPVGTVYVALARGEQSRVEKKVFTGDRIAIRAQSVIHALRMLLGKERSK